MNDLTKNDILINTIDTSNLDIVEEYETIAGWNECLNDLTAAEQHRFEYFIVSRARTDTIRRTETGSKEAEVWFVFAHLSEED